MPCLSHSVTDVLVFYTEEVEAEDEEEGVCTDKHQSEGILVHLYSIIS